MDPAPAPQPKPQTAAPNWGLWIAGLWVGILAVGAVATVIAWDDMLLALDVVRHL